jgi:hypothetical protein
MLKHRRLFLSLALVALVGIMAGEARAASISMTISVTGAATSFDIDAVAVATATSYTVDPTGLTAINGYLAANGSEYRFASSTTGTTTNLGGSSNFPGSTQGLLTVTGEIHALATAGTNAGVTITETESGFTSPTGFTGTLASSSSGTFTNQSTGGGHEVSSLFNSTPTSPSSYDVLSNTAIGNPNSETGSATGVIAPVPTLYTLTNVISWGVSAPGLDHPASGHPDTIDGFSVSAVVTAVPEPASLVTMMMGTPLPLAVLWFLRRRRALA